MASTSVASTSVTLPVTCALQNGTSQLSKGTFIRPLPIRESNNYLVLKPKSKVRLQVHASLKEKVVTGLTAAALTTSMVIPDIAEAAESSVSPSLKNFLLSIAAGGIVLGAIFGAVIGVSNFDPVKRT